MTDKEQIIIDGIDVSKCKNFKPKDRFTCHPYICNCHQKPNCYFKQLAYKTHEYQNLADLLRATDIYSEVCNECRDNILLYPSISNRTNYTDNEVDRITLRKIIDELKDKTQECEKLKEKQKIIGKAIYKESIELCNENDSYLKALEEIEEVAKFSYRPYTICGEYNEHCSVLAKVLDIINKAKE